jgi:hypothetical protein
MTPDPGTSGADRWARFAIRAYPADVRATREAEMMDTLRDIRATAPGRYPREVADLIRLGLRARAVQTARVGSRRILTDGLVGGAILVMMLELADLVAHRLRGLHDSLNGSATIISLTLVLAAALVGYDRLAAGGGFVWLILRTPDLYHDKGSLIGLAPNLVLLACFVVMAIAPRSGRFARLGSFARLGWLLVPGVLIAVEGPARPNPVLVAVVALAALLVVVGAASLAATDPRFGIACAVPAAYVGMQIVWKSQAPIALSTILLVALPAIVAYAAVRTRALRRIDRV